MQEETKRIETLLINNLSYILKQSIKVSPRDQLAIAQEYKEWINCVNASDFSKQEILVINRFRF